MHEYTLVTNLLDTVLELSEKEQKIPVEVTIAIGQFDIVVEEQLRELIQVQINNYPSLSNISISCKDIGGLYKCSDCSFESDTPLDLIRTGSHDLPLIVSCQSCGGTNVDLTEGDKTYIEKIAF